MSECEYKDEGGCECEGHQPGAHALRVRVRVGVRVRVNA